MLCEYCQGDLDRQSELPAAMRSRVWMIAGEERVAPLMLRRLFRILWSRRHSSPVSRASLMTLLYDMTDDAPESRGIINVHINRLRKLLAGSEYGIINHHDEGWQLVPTEIAARAPILSAWTVDRRE